MDKFLSNPNIPRDCKLLFVYLAFRRERVPFRRISAELGMDPKTLRKCASYLECEEFLHIIHEGRYTYYSIDGCRGKPSQYPPIVIPVFPIEGSVPPMTEGSPPSEGSVPPMTEGSPPSIDSLDPIIIKKGSYKLLPNSSGSSSSIFKDTTTTTGEEDIKLQTLEKKLLPLMSVKRPEEAQSAVTQMRSMFPTPVLIEVFEGAVVNGSQHRPHYFLKALQARNSEYLERLEKAERAKDGPAAFKGNIERDREELEFRSNRLEEIEGAFGISKAKEFWKNREEKFSIRSSEVTETELFQNLLRKYSP